MVNTNNRYQQMNLGQFIKVSLSFLFLWPIAQKGYESPIVRQEEVTCVTLCKNENIIKMKIIRKGSPVHKINKRLENKSGA